MRVFCSQPKATDENVDLKSLHGNSSTDKEGEGVRSLEHRLTVLESFVQKFHEQFAEFVENVVLCQWEGRTVVKNVEENPLETDNLELNSPDEFKAYHRTTSECEEISEPLQSTQDSLENDIRSYQQLTLMSGVMDDPTSLPSDVEDKSQRLEAGSIVDKTEDILVDKHPSSSPTPVDIYLQPSTAHSASLDDTHVVSAEPLTSFSGNTSLLESISTDDDPTYKETEPLYELELKGDEDTGNPETPESQGSHVTNSLSTKTQRRRRTPWSWSYLEKKLPLKKRRRDVSEPPQRSTRSNTRLSSENLELNTETHNPQNNFPFKTIDKLQEHKTSDDEDTQKPYKCSACPFSAKAPSTLRAHVLTHRKGNHLKCPLCQKKFHTPGTLYDHRRRVHEPPKLFECSHCPRSFKRADNLRRHEHNHK